METLSWTVSVAQCNHRVLLFERGTWQIKVRERFENAAVLALQMENEAMD